MGTFDRWASGSDDGGRVRGPLGGGPAKGGGPGEDGATGHGPGRGEPLDPKDDDSRPSLWGDDLLDEEARLEIVEAVRARPGSNISQVGRATGRAPSVANYHIKRLAKAGVLVKRERSRGNQIHCFLADDLDLWEDPRTRPLFGNTPLRAVARYVLEHPGAHTGEISEALESSRGTIRGHLKRLRERGLLSSCQFGRKVRHRPLPVLERWWAGVGDRLARRGDSLDRPGKQGGSGLPGGEPGDG